MASDPFVYRGVSLPLPQVGTFSHFPYQSHPYTVGWRRTSRAAVFPLPVKVSASRSMHAIVDLCLKAEFVDWRTQPLLAVDGEHPTLTCLLWPMTDNRSPAA